MRDRLVIIEEHNRIWSKVNRINDEYQCDLELELQNKSGSLYFLESFVNSFHIIWIDFDMISKESQEMLLFKLKQLQLEGYYIIISKTNPTLDEVRMMLKSGIYDVLEYPLRDDEILKIIKEIVIMKASNIHTKRTILPSKVIANLKSSLAYDLVFGNVKNVKEIWDRTNIVGHLHVPNTVILVHIDDFYKMVENKSEQWEHSIRTDVIQSIQRFLLNTYPETMVIVTEPDKIAILFVSKIEQYIHDYQLASIKLASDLKEHVLEDTNYSLTIGIGNYYEDARNIHISYQEAFRALENRFFTGKNKVIHITDVSLLQEYSNAILHNDISRTANKLIIGDVKGAQEEYEYLEKQLFNNINVTPKEFILQITNVVTNLSRAALQGGGNPKEVFNIHHELNNSLKKIENIDEIKFWLRNIMDCLFIMILECQNNKTSVAIQKAIKFVDENYHQPITLEEVSEHVNLTSNYFSNIFKKMTGKSFVEYLASIRIQKSKELLMNLNLTIYQVAIEVGYSDSRYFSRVFKNAVGKTPTQYRNAVASQSLVGKMI